jgi:hypothetical protein
VSAPLSILFTDNPDIIFSLNLIWAGNKVNEKLLKITSLLVSADEVDFNDTI